MCFTQPFTAIFGIGGLLVAALFQWKFPDKPRVAIGVSYFAGMEFIQFVQYFYVDHCEDFNNQLWTLLGFAHITFQPVFCALITSAFDKTDEDRVKSKLVIRLCIWGAIALWVAFFAGPMLKDTEEVGKCLDVVTHDWLRSTKLCTLTGGTHLAWHVPLARPSYLIPNSFLHFFCMFVPYFLEFKLNHWITGALSLLSGPLLAMYISPSVFEQASIWCYLSIFQIVLVTGRLLVPKSWRYCGKEPKAPKQEKAVKKN